MSGAAPRADKNLPWQHRSRWARSGHATALYFRGEVPLNVVRVNRLLGWAPRQFDRCGAVAGEHGVSEHQIFRLAVFCQLVQEHHDCPSPVPSRPFGCEKPLRLVLKSSRYVLCYRGSELTFNRLSEVITVYINLGSNNTNCIFGIGRLPTQNRNIQSSRRSSDQSRCRRQSGLSLCPTSS